MMTVVNKVRIFTAALCYWNYVNIRSMVVTMFYSSVGRAVAVLFIIALSPTDSRFFLMFVPILYQQPFAPELGSSCTVTELRTYADRN
jgi:hypothetical protein